MKTPAQDNSSPAATGSPGLSTSWRVAISALIVFHLAAVFTGPWAFAPLHSHLADDAYRLLRPYIETLALGNGYRFFAPEPGPSTLIHYEMTFADGSSRDGVIPDLKTEWPRLLYHRHFMLSEFLNSIDSPAAPEGVAKAYAESFAQHLGLANDADKVELSLRRHRLPTMEESRRGVALNDPSLYQDLPRVTYTKD